MKPNPLIRAFLLASVSPLLAVSSAHAQLYWDSNSTSAGFGNAASTLGTSNFWNTDPLGGAAGSFTTATSSSANVNFGTATLNFGSGTIGVAAGGVTVGGIVIGAGQTTAINLGTAGNPVTIHGGITKNNTTAAAHFIFNTSPVLLEAGQNWTNNTPATSLTAEVESLRAQAGINYGANTFTINGTGVTGFSGGNITGSGNFIKNGTGTLVFSANDTAVGNNSGTFSGNILLNAGVSRFQLTTALGTGNIEINGGILEGRFGQILSRVQGTAAGEIQITGGVSGFSGQGATGTGFDIGPVTWGSATFNPTAFLLQSATTNTNGNSTFSSAIDLAGMDRTIRSEQTSGTTGNGTFSGIISNLTGTAGLIKTGVGHLTLANASNSYNGSTTITQGILTANSSGALGDSSATNTLIFNGGTLRAGGAITSADPRGVTLTQTGIIDTNNQPVSIAGNISGAGGLTKNGANTLTLSGTNSYGGVTIVNAGTLQFATEGSLYNGTAANWTAANINVKSGATLALNADSAGSAGFSSPNLNTLLGNLSVANTAAQGLQAFATIALNTATATGGTFTQGNPITNSTGASGGLINLTKLGTGTLILDKTNTYTGQTTISAGTLQLNAGGVIATPILNNAAFAVNSAGAVTQGTHFGLISGTGAVTNLGTGTLTLNLANPYSGPTTATDGTIALTNALAIQNSTLVTTSGTTTLGAFSALTIGGLSGATGDLGSANVLTGYTGNVSALTLNPQTGISVTYGGVISNGAGAMSLTKTGAGTQILTGANTYTGATIVNAGTLTIGDNGSLGSSSALQINGGTFNYGNTLAGLTLNGLAAGAGNATLGNTAFGQTLALGAITRTGSAFGTINFADITGPVSTTTGNANGIIGPWATTGTGTSLRYAAGSPDGSTPTEITAFIGTTAMDGTLEDVTDATVNYESSAGAATAANLTANTFRYSGGTAVIALGATNTLTLNGLMQAGSGLLTISGGPATGGLLIGPTGELVFTANASATTISAAIGGTGRLVYSSAGSILLLNSTNSNYSGGTVINAGQLRIASNAALGNSSGSITLNGGTLVGNSTNPQVGNSGGVNIASARDVIVGNAGGSIGLHGNNNLTTTGTLSGSGTLTHLELGGGGGRTLNFNSTANSFTGRLVILSAGNTVSVNSLVDPAGSGNIALTFGVLNNGCTFAYGAGANAPLALNNRAIEINAGGTFSATILNNNTTQAISIGTHLLPTGAGAKTLTFNAVAGPSNVCSGNITDGTGGGTITLAKTGVGTWTISGTGNRYTGATSITGGTLVGIGANAFGNTPGITVGATAGAILSLRGDISTTFARASDNLPYPLTTTTASGVTFNVDQATVAGTAAKTMTIGTLLLNNAITNGTTFTGANQTSLSIGAVTTSPAVSGTETLTNNISGGGTLTLARIAVARTGSPTLAFAGNGNTIVSGNITQAAPTALTKSGTGTLVLSGANAYTGATTVSAGTLIVNGNQTTAPGATAVNGTSILGGTGTLGGSVTLAAGAGIAPGHDTIPAATLVIIGDLNLTAPIAGGTGRLAFDLGPVAASDRIALTGTLTAGTGQLGFSDFVFASLPGLANGTYKLITTGTPINSVTLDSANLTGLLGAGPASGTLQITGNDLELIVSGMVGGLGGYGLWSSTNAPTGTPDSDFDGDGVSNAVEFVLGGDKNTNDLGKLPVPAGGGTDLNFTFVRSQASIGNGTTTLIETGTLLTGWPDVFTVGATNADSTPGVTVAKDTPAAGQDTITLTLPRGTDPRKFARLKVTITP